MYFFPPSYFLTKEEISMKFWEMIENILMHVGLISIEVCIFNTKAVLKQFFMLILQLSKKITDAPSIFN